MYLFVHKLNYTKVSDAPELLVFPDCLIEYKNATHIFRLTPLPPVKLVVSTCPIRAYCCGGPSATEA